MTIVDTARRSALSSAITTALGLFALTGIPVGTTVAAESAVSAPPTGTTGTMGSNTRIVQLKKIVVQAGAETTSDQAPTQASLVATEPQSIIGDRYIENVAASTANYSDIVKIAPSVSDVDPNGPGLMESQGLSIRGFQNGEYNVTFDGIPWGDSNDFTQHSTSYFMPQDIAQVTLDRGPGSARTLGNATFGGTLSVDSKNPDPVTSINPFFSVASFNTQVEGLRFDTGTLKPYGGTTAYFSAKNLSSDGYLTHAGLNRQNFFAKVVQPLGADTTLTFATNLTRLHQNVSLGATKAQIAQFGPNYGLSADPTSQSYYGYNYDDITTDFEYLDLETTLAGWQVGDKLYTYGYRHRGYNGADPTWLPGLDVLGPLGLPVAVIPHYDNAEGGTHDTRFCYLGEPRLATLEDQLPLGHWVLGIDSHTALVLDLETGTAVVEGVGGVTVRVAGRSQRRADGDAVGVGGIGDRLPGVVGGLGVRSDFEHIGRPRLQNG